MGWTSFNMKDPVREWFKKQWDYENSDYEVIDSALVARNTLYGAVKQKSTGEVFCAVFLIRWSRSYYNFSYKDMTEHAGPTVCNCPERIMKLLSPLKDDDSNGYAKEWRKRVEEYWKERKTINKGNVVKTENPVSFTSGDTYQYFKKRAGHLWAGILNERNEFQPMCRVRVNLSHYNFETL